MSDKTETVGKLGRRGMAERNAVLKLNCLAPLIVLISLPKECGLSRKVWSVVNCAVAWDNNYCLFPATHHINSSWAVDECKLPALKENSIPKRHSILLPCSFTNTVKLHDVYRD